jgi:hypothetical protein
MNMNYDVRMMDLQKIADAIGIERNDRLTMSPDELLSFIHGTLYVIMQERKHLKQQIARLEKDNKRFSQLTVWDYTPAV